jgi:GNAT superfamily N-acetyltransferase
MENLIKLQKAGFLIKKIGRTRTHTFSFYEVFGLFNVGGKACGFLQVSLDAELNHDLSDRDFRNDLFDAGDAVDEDCEITAVEIYKRSQSDPKFMKALRGATYWNHVDYCFVSKEHRGQGLGALFLLAYVEAFAPDRIITLIPELKSAKLIEYWQNVAGFQQLDPMGYGGPIFMFSPDETDEGWFKRLKASMIRHKEEIHGVSSDDDDAERLSKR